MKPLHQNHIRAVVLAGAPVLMLGVTLAMIRIGWPGSSTTTRIPPTPYSLPTTSQIASLVDFDKVTERVLVEVPLSEDQPGYRIDELTLPQTLTIELEGKSTRVDKFWQISIYLETALPGYNQVWVLWIDKTPLFASNIAEGLTTFVDDYALLRDGAVLGISSGPIGSGPTTILPVTLTLGSGNK